MRHKAATPWPAIFLTLVGAAAGQSPEMDRWARFQEKARQDMTSIPNYTCLETIERMQRDPHARSFKHIDTVRLEVSSVAGKELFAWPGARRFEEGNVTALVTGGAMGTGTFAIFAHKLFVTGKGAFEYRGDENLAGRAAVRYDFHLTQKEADLEITVNGASEVVSAKGSFWFDPISLDLIRLDVYGAGLPYSLGLAETVFQTDYARTHIGDADALLPRRSELTMTHFSGGASRNAIEFSQCHEYRSQSTISFDAPADPEPKLPKPQIREVELPAGLLVPIEMETVIDSKTASVGDTLKARVADEIRHKGDVLIPRGAALTGHIRKLGRGSGSTTYAVGIEFSEVEWAGAHAAFYAELVDVDRKTAGTHRPATYYDGHANRVLIEHGLPGAGVFYINGAGFRIPAGLHMVWRTLVRSGRIEE